MATAFSYRNNGPAFSDSDSDDSDKECLNWKRATKNETEAPEKVPLIPPPAEPSVTVAMNTSKRKRNTIWTEVLQDQLMSETLTQCGIKSKPKGYGERGAESYDYRAGKRGYEEDESDQDEEMSEQSYRKPFKRFKSDNYVEVEPDGAAVAKEIINELQEQKKYLIYRIVKYIGKDKAMEFLKQTKDIEEKGGMMIKNQSRRRTPGGVFMFLLRSDTSLEKDLVDKIFDGELNSYERKRKLDEIRKKKRKNKKKKKKGNKECMDLDSLPIKDECPSSDEEPHIKKETEFENMEDDNFFINVKKENVGTISIKKEDSDLEEGEIE